MRAAIGYAVLALAGQLAVLLLTQAGPVVAYQHFLPLDGSGAWRMAARLVLVLQTVIVAAALRRHGARLRQVLTAVLPGWRLPAVLVLVALTSATVSRDPKAFGLELMLASLVQLVQLATILLVAMLWRDGGRAGNLAGRTAGAPAEGPEPGGPDRFALACAAWTVIVAWLVAVLSYERHPHVPDEIVYLLHARYFAEGLLTMPAPPVPAGFDLDLMTFEPDRWFSPVPPGWPAILSLGVRLGMPWLVNPLLGGLGVLLGYSLLRELYPRRTARIATLLLSASPWALFIAMSLTTHAASLVCALAAALAVARLRRGGPLALAVLGGAMIGAVSLIRPLEGLVVALLLGIWSLRARWRTIPLVPSALLTLSTMAATAINLPYNKALTGSATTFPIMDYTDRLYGAGTNAMGFGPNRGLGWSGLDPFPGHGLRDVVVNTNLNVFQVNTELLGWACGSLLFVWLLLVSRPNRADLALLSATAAVIALHAFYWFSGGPDFGARYWYLIIVPLVALAARGIETAGARLAAAGAGDRNAPLAMAAALVIMATLLFVPWRAIDKYHHYRGMRPDIRELIRDERADGHLVLIRGRRHPDYHSAAPFNPVDLRSDATVLAWARSDSVEALLRAAYPGRRVLVVDGPTVTGNGFRIVTRDSQ